MLSLATMGLGVPPPHPSPLCFQALHASRTEGRCHSRPIRVSEINTSSRVLISQPSCLCPDPGGSKLSVLLAPKSCWHLGPGPLQIYYLPTVSFSQLSQRQSALSTPSGDQSGTGTVPKCSSVCQKHFDPAQPTECQPLVQCPKLPLPVAW